MAESWFDLSRDDQAEALEFAASSTGRPAHLLEKDIWVVWTLSAIYRSALANTLTFKGGTSLSKVYKIIDRFSEDIDLTYDIRELVPDLLSEGDPIPASFNKAKRISDEVRKILPSWIETTVRPIIEQALSASALQMELSIDERDKNKLILKYSPLKTGTGYAPPTIKLEFGARATGEPHQTYSVVCDIAAAIEDVEFPTAQPLVMAAERTFWEKATAAHVYCLQGELRENYSRHWYDLVAMAKTKHFDNAVSDRQFAAAVAEHKSLFFRENDADRNRIDYSKAVNGELRLVPSGKFFDVLAEDYEKMLKDRFLALGQPSFSEIMANCQDIQNRINKFMAVK